MSPLVRPRVAIPLCIAFLYLVLSVASARALMPWCDEAWFSSPALNLITHGYMGTSVLDPTATWRHVVLTGIHRYTYWITPLYPLAQAAWYELFGFSLFAMRLLSACCGLVALTAWFLIVKRLSGDERAALLTAGLLAIDFQFLWSASVGRMDMMCAALGAAGIAVYLRLRESHFALAVVCSQALVVAAGLAHPTGIIAFVWLLFFTLRYDRARIRPRHVALAATPYLAGATGWGLYIAQNPSLFVAQFGGNASDRWLALRAPLTALKLELVRRYLYSYGLAPDTAGFSHLKIVVLAAYGAALAGILFSGKLRRRRDAQALLFFFVSALLILNVIDGEKQQFYLIHTIPALTGLLAIWLCWLWDRRPVLRWLVALGICGFALVQLATVGSRIRQDPYRRSYLATASFLKQHAASGIIMGSAELAFQLGFESGLVDDYRLGFRSGKKPDVVVIDKNRYAEWIPLLEQQDPPNYRYISKLMQSFRPVFECDAYRVYSRSATDRALRDQAISDRRLAMNGKP